MHNYCLEQSHINLMMACTALSTRRFGYCIEDIHTHTLLPCERRNATSSGLNLPIEMPWTRCGVPRPRLRASKIIQCEQQARQAHYIHNARAVLADESANSKVDVHGALLLIHYVESDYGTNALLPSGHNRRCLRAVLGL